MKKQLILTFALAGILTAFYTWYHAQATRFVTLSARLHTSTDLKTPILQVFYDIGHGYREHDSHSFLLNPEADSQELLYTIPSNILYGIRLDFLNGPGSVNLQQVQLISSSGKNILTLAIPEQAILNQAQLNSNTPGSISLTALPSANDPYVVIPFNAPLLSPEGHFDLSHVLFGVKIFFALFTGITLIFLFSSFPLTSSQENKLCKTS